MISNRYNQDGKLNHHMCGRCCNFVFPSLSMMTSSNENIFRVTGPLCGEFTGPGEFPTQRPVTRSFDVFFDLRPNKRLSKQWRGWWFETLSRPFWRHRNVYEYKMKIGMYVYVEGICDRYTHVCTIMAYRVPETHKIHRVKLYRPPPPKLSTTVLQPKNQLCQEVGYNQASNLNAGYFCCMMSRSDKNACTYKLETLLAIAI